MKAIYTLLFLLMSGACLYAQTTPVSPKKDVIDSIKPGHGSPEKQLSDIKKVKIEKLTDSTGNAPKKTALVDTTVQNKYGGLLNDDTGYNQKYKWWKPSLGVLGTCVTVFSMDRFLLKSDFSTSVSLDTWKHNLQTGWEWDKDRFGVNFIGHPYTGSLYFNAGRSNGYNYLQSTGFAVAGSLIWEYFGENTLPSYNDQINTPVSGAFFGEILYRLSSNILDDRTRGRERVFREIAAGLIDPMRGVTRLFQGKTFRRTNNEVYQKEPLNVSLFAGYHKINQGNRVFGSGTSNLMLNIQFDYGNPFEVRTRKPFDFFKLRTEFNFGVGRKILDNITGYGILFGKTRDHGKHAYLLGGFQYYDYWDNYTFELGAIAFGGGAFSKLALGKTSTLYTNVHLALVPFSGNSTRFGPDTSQVRDYTFGDGFEGKIESTLNLGKYVTTSLSYYYYFIHTYVGQAGNNIIGILRPRVTVKLYKDLSVGYEHFVYYDARFLQGMSAIHSIRTEQKIFLYLYLEDKQRRGKYN
jgi:hypothetical protein